MKTQTSLAKMEFSMLHFGTYKRPDGEAFGISARLYACPADYDYWLGIFDVVHKSWKTTHITSFIPKAVANSIHSAKVLLKEDGLAQVKSKLLEAGPNRPTILSLDINGPTEPGRMDLAEVGSS